MKKFLSKIGLPIRLAPLQGIFLLIIKSIDALVPVFQVLLLSELIDSLVTENLIFIFFLLLTIVYSRISGNLRIMAEQKMILELKENLNPLIIEKIASLQYKYIEDEETYNLTERISSKPEEILKKCVSPLTWDFIPDCKDNRFKSDYLFCSACQDFLIACFGGSIFYPFLPRGSEVIQI